MLLSKLAEKEDESRSVASLVPEMMPDAFKEFVDGEVESILPRAGDLTAVGNCAEGDAMSTALGFFFLRAAGAEFVGPIKSTPEDEEARE